MFFLAGAAASGALDLISTLQQSLAPKPSGAGAQPFELGADPTTSTLPQAPTGSLAPGTMNALLAAQGQARPANDGGLGTLLSSLDADTAVGENEPTAPRKADHQGLLDRLMQRQAQMLASAPAGQSVAMNV